MLSTFSKLPVVFYTFVSSIFEWPFYTRFTVHVCLFEPRHEISNNVVCAPSKASDQPAHTHSLIRAFASRLSIL